MEAINKLIAGVNNNGIASAALAYGLGLASANIPYLIRLVVTSRWVSGWIKNHPAEAEAIVTALKTDVEEEIAAPAAEVAKPA